MGLCTSCDAGKAAATTAKVILQDGRLQEYSYPAKACYVLQRDPDYFLCNSDEMEFDDHLTAVDADDELQPGQIYFVLPLSFLKRPLQPQEMASLAVKASAALAKCSTGASCAPRTNLVFAPSGYRDPKSASRKAAANEGRSKARSNGGGRRNKVFTANLDAIAE